MSRSRKAALLMLFCLAPCLYSVAEEYSGEYAVIVNPKNPAQNISSAQLRRLVMGEEKFWPGRLPVSIIVQDDRSVERGFMLKKVINMSSTDYRTHWTTLVFRGGAVSEPLAVPSNGLASGLVAVQEGGLCIMRTDNLPKKESVKVLRVDGKLPGETGYPLH